MQVSLARLGVIAHLLQHLSNVDQSVNSPFTMSSPSAPTSSLPNSFNPKPNPEDQPDDSDLTVLITSLRASLSSSQTLLQTQTTRLATLNDIETDLLQTRDALTFVTAAKEAVELQFKEEIRKREVAEENVELLRGQVEQARRGVGILQKQEKERKRLSTLPPGGLVAQILIPDEEGELELQEKEKEAKLARRQSTKNNRGQHRRVSSQSEVEEPMSPNPNPNPSPNPGAPVPRAGGLRELRLGQSPIPHVTNPATTSLALFEDPLPVPAAPGMTKGASNSSSSLSKEDLERERERDREKETEKEKGKETAAAQKEMTRIRAEMIGLQARLAESEEAREASESCLRALREFMAGGPTDEMTNDPDLLKIMRLPPLPTDRDPDEVEPEPGIVMDKAGSKEKKPGWGFKIWRQPPTSPAASTTVEPPATPGSNLSPPNETTPRVSPIPSEMLPPNEVDLENVPSGATPLTLVTG